MPTLDEHLSGLAQLHAQLVALQATQAQARLAVLPQRVRDKLAALDATYAPQLEALQRAIAAQTTQVKAAVLQHGHSVKGHGLHAVYLGGRVSWDDGALQGFAVVHPEILRFRTVGQPSVSLRQEKGSGDGA
jgi:hypothetical protein